MDDIKQVAQVAKKIIGDSDTTIKKIQSGYRNGIWHRKMCHDQNEKREKTINRWDRTAKSRKNQNDWGKGSFYKLVNIGSWHHQASEEERKIRKEYLIQTRKYLKTEHCG